MRIVRRIALAAGGLLALAAVALAVMIYVLEYHHKLSPRRTEAVLMGGTQTTAVHCQRGWEHGLFSDWSYVFHWTYACTFHWKKGLGPPEQLGVKVNARTVVDSELG
jgi:hypothetical protein